MSNDDFKVIFSREQLAIIAEEMYDAADVMDSEAEEILDEWNSTANNERRNALARDYAENMALAKKYGEIAEKAATAIGLQFADDSDEEFEEELELEMDCEHCERKEHCAEMDEDDNDGEFHGMGSCIVFIV